MRGDWMQILETAYTTADDETAWARSIVDVTESAFGTKNAVNVLTLQHGHGPSIPEPIVAVGAIASAFAPLLRTWPREHMALALKRFFYPPTLVSTFRERLTQLPEDEHARLVAFAANKEVADAVGLVFHPEAGIASVLFGLSSKTPSGSERRLLTQLALHLETSHRLLRRPETLRAVLSSHGKVLHLEDGEDRTAPWTEQVRRIERARLRATRRSPEAIDLWQALTAGDVSLVERTDGSQRHYLVVENPPTRQALRALNPGEVDAVSYSARGLSTKLVAYALGVSPSTVSTRLASAAMKVGLATRLDLVRVAALLANDPQARFEENKLSTAERSVLELVERGLSNKDIARLRGRSIRTIANQVARLLSKTGASSRRQLVTRM